MKDLVYTLDLYTITVHQNYIALYRVTADAKRDDKRSSFDWVQVCKSVGILLISVYFFSKGDFYLISISVECSNDLRHC